MIDWELIKLIRKLQKQNKYINEYYQVSRTHLSLEKNSPVHRPVQTEGKIVSKPILRGLNHVYGRVAWPKTSDTLFQADRIAMNEVCANYDNIVRTLTLSRITPLETGN